MPPEVTAAVAITLAVATAVAQPPDPPAFRTGVDLVALNVTVTDGADRYVTDIRHERTDPSEGVDRRRAARHADRVPEYDSGRQLGE